jgi:hypothetical protein
MRYQSGQVNVWTKHFREIKDVLAIVAFRNEARSTLNNDDGISACARV